MTVTQGVLFASLSEGTGEWLVEIVRAEGAGGSILQAAHGRDVQCAFILQPGELIQATVTDALQRRHVRGSVHGTQALDPAELPPLYAGGQQSSEVDTSRENPLWVRLVPDDWRVRIRINVEGEEVLDAG
jgi:hypothetical protein